MKLILSTMLYLSTALAVYPYQIIDADIHSLRNLTRHLNASLATVMRGSTAISQLIDITSQENAILAKTNSTTQDIQGSPQLSKFGSGHISTRIIKFTSEIIETLDNTVAAKPFFDDPSGQCQYSVAGVVLSNLQQQQEEADALAAALVKILTPAYRKAAPAIQKELDNAFNSAISVYSATTTTSCTPIPTPTTTSASVSTTAAAS